MDDTQIIPILLCVDVEPDDRRPNPDECRPWHGFPAMVECLDKYRAAFSELSGSSSHFSWFLRVDHQIEVSCGSSDWALKEYSEIIVDLLENEDEIGLHVHAWKWSAELSDWVADHGDQNRIEKQLAEAFDKFYAFFGRHCRSFRYGDHWMNDKTMRFLEALGVRYEMTIEPGRFPAAVLNKGEYATGKLPDYRRAVPYPYRMSSSNYLIPDPENKKGLWVIPVSAGINIPLSPDWLKRKVKKIIYSQMTNTEKQPLNLGYTRPMAFRETVEVYLKKKDLPHLVLVSRTDAPLASRQSQWMEENLNYLLTHEFAPNFRFVRPDQFIEMFQGYELNPNQPALRDELLCNH